MSSYLRKFEHPSYKIINHRRYKYLRSYIKARDAGSEAGRWNREPYMSAKITEHEGLFTVWIADKRKWRR